MELWIKNDESEQLLAGGAQRVIGEPVGPDRLRVNGKVALQERTFLRGETAKAALRGNGRTVVSWTSHYEFDSVDEAEFFATTHAADVQRDHELRMLVADAEGNPVMVRVPHAVLESVDPQQVGVSVSVAYSLTGGKIERIET